MTITAEKKETAKSKAVKLSKDDRDRGAAVLMELRTVTELPSVRKDADRTSIQRIAVEIVENEMRAIKFSIFIKRVAGDDVDLQRAVVAMLLPLCFERIEDLKRKSENNLATLSAQQLGGMPDKLPSASVAH